MRHEEDTVAPDAPGAPLDKVQSNHERSESSMSAVHDADQKYGWQIDASEFDNISSNKTGLARTRSRRSNLRLSKQRTLTAFGGRLKLRPDIDDEPTDWWFASTAIPLIVATFAPMANMLSIAALVVSWRLNTTTDDPVTRYSTGVPDPDPQWLLDLNGASLACGFVGNAFLLFNFTRKVRYIIALPVSIVLFYIAGGILAGITAGLHIYDPATAAQVYSQGFWHAIVAACLYSICAVLLMVNMLGYFLGHYNQHFDLNDEQRNLILQTMIFFIWLAGGAAVFAKLEGWTFPDALYFGNVTLLTIGFGDYFATNDLGRGLVFPYSVGGTIILGLLVSSIHKFAQELSKENVVKKHVETRRVNTLSRVVTDESQIGPNQKPIGPSTVISRPLEADTIQHDLDEKAKLDRVASRTIDFHVPSRTERAAQAQETDGGEPAPSQFRFTKDAEKRGFLRTLTLDRVVSIGKRIPMPNRSQKAIMMRNEKDRFDKMRQIQYEAAKFKKWYALTLSIIAFGLLWCVGAMVFYFTESNTQGLSYFQALYFCYVSLLTIGYGDLSPKSNAGKAFFVLWSLVAVPTITILVSDLGDTVIGGFKRRVLKYGGLAFLGKGRGWGLDWFTQRKENLGRRFRTTSLSHTRASVLEAQSSRDQPDGNGDDDELVPRTVEELVEEEISEPVMMRRLAFALRRVADDMRNNPQKRYSYEEWVEYTRLIRFTRLHRDVQKDDHAAQRQLEYDEAVDGIIEWDWLDHKSPMASEQSEAEWLLDRLLESLLRSFRKSDLLAAVSAHHADQEHHHHHLHPHLLHSSHSHLDARPPNEDRSSRMSISQARRHSSFSITSAQSRRRESTLNTTNTMTTASAMGDTALRNKSTDEPVLESEEPNDTSGWSKRGQARLAARQARRATQSTILHPPETNLHHPSTDQLQSHPASQPDFQSEPQTRGQNPPHLHAQTRFGSAAVSLEHQKSKFRDGLGALLGKEGSRSRSKSPTGERRATETETERREQSHTQTEKEVVATSRHGRQSVEVAQRDIVSSGVL